MEDILLYEFPFSNFCEKIEWSLDYKKLKWKSVSLYPLDLTQIKKLQLEKTLTPTIHDLNNGKSLSDSTQIMIYLDDAYPDSPKLFPPDSKKEIYEYCVLLDSTLGLAARRVFYGRFVVDCKENMYDLFVKPHDTLLAKIPFFSGIISTILAILVMQRYSLNTNLNEGTFKTVEKSLDDALQRLAGSGHLFGEFSAADITFFSFLRTLRTVPYFKNNPKYSPLFRKMEELFQKHNRPATVMYEDLVARSSGKKSYFGMILSLPYRVMCGLVALLYSKAPSSPKLNMVFPKTETHADNDQQPIPISLGLWKPKTWFSYLFQLEIENQPPQSS